MVSKMNQGYGSISIDATPPKQNSTIVNETCRVDFSSIVRRKVFLIFFFRNTIHIIRGHPVWFYSSTSLNVICKIIIDTLIMIKATYKLSFKKN